MSQLEGEAVEMDSGDTDGLPGLGAGAGRKGNPFALVA